MFPQFVGIAQGKLERGDNPKSAEVQPGGSPECGIFRITCRNQSAVRQRDAHAGYRGGEIAQGAPRAVCAGCGSAADCLTVDVALVRQRQAFTLLDRAVRKLRRALSAPTPLAGLEGEP